MDNIVQFIELILVLLGPIVFVLVWLQYRNIRARHFHERETPAEITEQRVNERFCRHLTGQRSRTLPGANGGKVAGSLVAGSPMDMLRKL